MATKTETVDIDYLRERLHYDPETGKLFWKDHEGMPKWWRVRYAEKEAFTYINPDGYHQGSVDCIRLKCHRVAWAIYYGKWPEQQLDHINGVRADNRIKNLRGASNQENQRNAAMKKNNTSGVNGVYWHKRSKKWVARMVVDRKVKHLGLFDTIEEAAKARQEENERKGFTERHGKPLTTKDKDYEDYHCTRP